MTELVIGTAPGPVVHLLPHGATVQQLWVTGGDGVRRNVVLGHATPADYLASTAYVGGSIGRYANRIADGRFVLDGREVEVGAHDRGNHLHGGPDGFDRRKWDVVDHTIDAITMRIVSPDGDQGFPGEVTATATFAVEGDTVRATYRATTDAPTVVSMTNHAYFNLDGDGSGSIDHQQLRIAASAFTPIDATGIPLGDHAPVEGTPFDFRLLSPIGTRIRAPHPQLLLGPGIDHNYVLDGAGWRDVAVLESPQTRTRMTLATDQPGLQVYTGNFLDGRARSTTGFMYRQGDGIALEPQLFPDSPNHPEWPSATLRPGEVYEAGLSWKFGAVDE